MFKRTASETRTTNSSVYNSTNTSTDSRVAADNGAIVTRGNVTVTDGGAIAMAADIGGAAIEAGEFFARTASGIASDGLDAGEALARRGLDAGEALAAQGMDYGQTVAETGFDLAVTSLESTNQTLQRVIDQDRAESAKLSEQLVQMIPYIVAGVVVWGVMK